MGDSVQNGNDKLNYKGVFLQWQDAMHPIFCSLLAKSLVLSTPPFPRPDKPANVANPANTRRQKLVDDWDKGNELATVAIFANLPPWYKHLVRDDTFSAGEYGVFSNPSSVLFPRPPKTPHVLNGCLAFNQHLNLSMSTLTIAYGLSITCLQCELKNLKSLFSLAFFTLSTSLALERNALSLIHGGDARGQLTTLPLTSGMPSRNSGRRNPKAAPWRWPCPHDSNLL